MADLPETAEWVEGIYQLEKSDPVSGGAEINQATKQGISNLPLLQLASRTAYLKQRLEAMRTTESILVEVGAGGDFATISAAVEEVSLLQRGYSQDPVFCEIRLRAGFVMEEALYASGIDLSWLMITGVDEVTGIARSAIPEQQVAGGGGTYPAFLAANNGVLPIISQLFEMDSSGAATNRIGIQVIDSRSVVLPGCGVRMAGWYGATVAGGSLFAEEANFDGAGHSGVRGTRVGQISFLGGTAKNCGQYGAFIWRSARLDGGMSDLSGAGTNGILCQEGGVSNIPGSNCRRGAEDATSDIRIANGGIINCSGFGGTAIGGTNVTPNTLTAAGIIFK